MLGSVYEAHSVSVAVVDGEASVTVQRRLLHTGDNAAEEAEHSSLLS